MDSYGYTHSFRDDDLATSLPDASAGQTISRMTTAPEATPRPLVSSGSASGSGGGGFWDFLKSAFFTDQPAGTDYLQAAASGARAVSVSSPDFGSARSALSQQNSQILSSIQSMNSGRSTGLHLDKSLYTLQAPKIDWGAGRATQKAGGSRLLLLALVAAGGFVAYKKLKKSKGA